MDREDRFLAGRREVLKALGLTTVGTALSSWAGELPLATAIHHHLEQKAAEARPAGPWKPQFFSPQEAETVSRLTDLILPSDGTPGAKDAAATEFLDLYLAKSSESAGQQIREGLRWLDSKAREQFEKNFVELDEARQVALLTPLSSSESDEIGVDFFKKMRELTVLAFYTSKVGIRELGYVGNTYAAVFPGACTHQHEL